jgi:AcrR family transcriptional regulator
MNDDRAPDARSELDEAMRRLWGLEAARRRGPKPALNVQLIVDATLQIADTEGLAGVSMTSVGAALHCTSMALYRHIASKDELITLLVDRVAADEPAIPERLSWREGLRRWTQIQIDGVLAHPWLLDLPLASIPVGPHRARWIDQGFAVMRTLNLPMADKGQIIALLSQHVLAEARVRVEIHNAARNPYADLGQLIHWMADREDLPHLFAAFAEESAEAGPDGFGIELILDGIAARVRQKQRDRKL